MKIIDYDDENYTIYLEYANFSLYDLINFLKKNKFSKFFSSKNILYLLKTLINIVFSLFKINIYHSDIKPSNIVFINCSSVIN